MPKYSLTSIPMQARLSFVCRRHTFRCSIANALRYQSAHTYSTSSVSKFAAKYSIIVPHGQKSLTLFRKITAFFHPYLKIYSRHAFLFGSGIALIKSTAADFAAQTQIECRSNSELNFDRLLLFAMFGLFYTGFVHYGIYCKLYPKLSHFLTVQTKIMSNRSSQITQVMIDSLIHTPFLYFPAFYAVKGLIMQRTLNCNYSHIEGEELSTTETHLQKSLFNSSKMQCVRRSLHTYFYCNFSSDVSAMLAVWLPANVLTFGVIPVHWRVPWLASVSFMWTLYLSHTRGDYE